MNIHQSQLFSFGDLTHPYTSINPRQVQPRSDEALLQAEYDRKVKVQKSI